jgi:NADH:ubiquinone oxidoreductase subunit 6 (subunit J)
MSSPAASETLVSVHNPAESRAGAFPLRFSVSPLSPVPTYVGIVLVLVGFVLMGITWGQVAGETTVAAQLPSFASGGFVGLGLVMVGLTTVTVAARRRDTQLRAQQMQLLADALEELRQGRERR